ncbi:hypothetical protein PoB_007172100 [Plakobranchus ocellatus]|uniref:TNFR-Cys domain-containing protein n=1 Tax=Plakobranchus ocellatus TaxID=259542 RepID=A0AAV4DM32_9GAST|nr:hypothetical protein PoB_007172100 [Plakobranchus ocellatus]
MMNKASFTSKAMQALLIDILLVQWSSCESNYSLHCSEGQFLNQSQGKEICSDCKEGKSYMDEINHRITSCKICTKADMNSPYYNIDTPCNKFKDVKITCRLNFFRDPHLSDNLCKLCTNCTESGMFFAEFCTEDEDSKCCPDEGMRKRNESCIYTDRASKSKDAINCLDKYPKDIPTGLRACSKGEYFVGNHCISGDVICQPCPPEKCMDRSKHLNRECDKCPPKDDDRIISIAVPSVAVFLIVILVIVAFCKWDKLRCKKEQAREQNPPSIQDCLDSKSHLMSCGKDTIVDLSHA